MDTQYCEKCGLLHDPNDGDCVGCQLRSELRAVNTDRDKWVTDYNQLRTENERLREVLQDWRRYVPSYLHEQTLEKGDK